jgi:potassium efflux system protein
VSVGVGFGLQEIVSNFVSGLILLLERPIRVDDIVTVGDQTGTVKRITIRATAIQNADN